MSARKHKHLSYDMYHKGRLIGTASGSHPLVIGKDVVDFNNPQQRIDVDADTFALLVEPKHTTQGASK
jgi:hypothetical protein